MLLDTIAAISVLALSTSDVSFAVLDRTLGHLDGVDDTVKDAGDNVPTNIDFRELVQEADSGIHHTWSRAEGTSWT
jgi:hypothetical protein